MKNRGNGRTTAPKKTKAQETHEARQSAVAMHNRDLSTEELGFRITHANTLIALYEGQRQRNAEAARAANDDARTCQRMIDELSADRDTLTALVAARRN